MAYIPCVLVDEGLDGIATGIPCRTRDTYDRFSTFQSHCQLMFPEHVLTFFAVPLNLQNKIYENLLVFLWIDVHL